MTTVGKGDDAETEKARISAVLSENNKPSSHKSSSNISIRDKYSATVPKMLLQEKTYNYKKWSNKGIRKKEIILPQI